MTETPFKIAVPDASIQLLQQKLALTVLPDELDDAGWDYGAPLSDIRRLVARWRDGYDWRKHEAQINDALPQFTRDIDVDSFGALNIHYVHQKSQVDDAIPLLFVHGCEYCAHLHEMGNLAHTIHWPSFRAWKLFGSQEDTSAAFGRLSGTSRLSCRCLKFARLRFLRGPQDQRIWATSICRGRSSSYNLIEHISF
jgi:hypothetical protein